MKKMSNEKKIQGNIWNIISEDILYLIISNEGQSISFQKGYLGYSAFLSGSNAWFPYID